MRTDATQIYKKRVTRNTLNIQQMLKLEELGLCVLSERDRHTETHFGVEELMQLKVVVFILLIVGSYAMIPMYYKNN